MKTHDLYCPSTHGRYNRLLSRWNEAAFEADILGIPYTFLGAYFIILKKEKTA